MMDYSTILEKNRIKTDKNYDCSKFINQININLLKLKEPLILSLSGGVDSMVLLFIIKEILHKNVIAIHINYKNRDESDLEADFLINFCNKIDVKIEIMELNIKRRDSKRKNYEIYSTKKRYSFYYEILEKYFVDYIILGHHKDDIVENIFNNFIKGISLFNLGSMKLTGTRNNINIIRPLIDFHKIEVYSIANNYFIPYFNDTTPDWSQRGIFRNETMKCLEKSYNNPKQNLLSVSEQLTEWSDVIESLIVNPILESVNYSIEEHGIDVEFCFEKLNNHVLWMEILKRIYHKYSLNCPSNKSVKNLINNLHDGTVCLTKDSIATIKNNYIIIKIII